MSTTKKAPQVVGEATEVVEVETELAADIGNSELAAYINGKLERFPNVFASTIKSGDPFPKELDELIPDLLEEMFVSITSESLTRPYGKLFVGHNAIKSGEKPVSIQVQYEKKYKSNIPMISTLSLIANSEVKKYYSETKQLPQEMNIKVKHAVFALPINAFNAETAKTYKERFTQHTHLVTVYINKGQRHVLTKITFENVLVTGEGIPAIYALMQGKDNKFRTAEDAMFSDFRKLYSEDKEAVAVGGKDFLKKRVVHIDIGDGTTDFPITSGINLNRDVLVGINSGVGHAILKSLDSFRAETNLTKVERQKYSEYLINENSDYHTLAWELIEQPALDQADSIFQEFISIIDKIDNAFDYVLVYGGGSIVLREGLYPMLQDVCDQLGKKLLWIPKELAPIMNVEGLKIMLYLSKKNKSKK